MKAIGRSRMRDPSGTSPAPSTSKKISVPRIRARMKMPSETSADGIEGVDRPPYLGEKLRRIDLRAERAGIHQHDLSRDRLEGGAEMVHGLDRDRPVARGVDAQRGELAEIVGLAVVGDENDVDAADPEHQGGAVVPRHAAAHRPSAHELAIGDASDLALEG